MKPAAAADPSELTETVEAAEPPEPAERDRTDLRLLPTAAAAWAAGWLAPTMSLSMTARAVVLLMCAGAAAAGVGAAGGGRVRVGPFGPEPVGGGPDQQRLRRRRSPQTAELTAQDGGAFTDPLRRRSPAVGQLWSAATALVVAAAVLAIAAIGGVRASGSIVDELAAERAVITAQLRITSDARLVQLESGPMTPPLRLLSAVVVDVSGRGQRASASAPVVVLAPDAAWDSLVPSSVVQATGRLAPNDRVSREVAVLRVVGAPEEIAPPSTVQRVAEHLRAGLRTAVEGMPADARGLLPGLVVGDESLMPADLIDDAKTTGLTHLTAVSGANVAIVLGVVLGAARWCGLRAWFIPAVGAVALAGFVVLARPDPSVLRATVMGLVVILGMASGSRRRRLSGLCAAVVVLLLVDPWLSRSYGFALSVLASAAIVLLVPGWTDRWSRWLPKPLAAALAVPVAAQLVCAPVVVMLSDRVSVVAVVANLLAAPAVAPATVLGVVVAVIAPVAPLPAALVARLAGVPAGWIADVARWFSDRPFAVVDWPGTAAGALALAAATIAAVTLLPRLLRRPLVVLAALVAGLALWGVRATGTPWPPPGWQLAACDVGQGDAVVLPVGPASAVVVDTGPDAAAVDACLRRLGVTDVPLLVLTHDHVDHTGGLLGVLAGRRVAAVATGPSHPLGPPTDRLASALAGSGVQHETLAAGWSATIGALWIEVLWPPADSSVLQWLDPAESAENNASLVTRVTGPSGVRILLTGDVEPSAQRALMRSGADLRSDVLKVPHHGSRYQDAGFLRAVAAAAAVISVGVDNDYGHPSSVTTELLAAAGTRIFRTDTDGAIAVAGTAQSLDVATTEDRAAVEGALTGPGHALVSARRGRLASDGHSRPLSRRGWHRPRRWHHSSRPGGRSRGAAGRAVRRRRRAGRSREPPGRGAGRARRDDP